MDKKKKKLSFIKSAKINALLFLVSVQIRKKELFIYLIVYYLFIFFSISNDIFSPIRDVDAWLAQIVN